MSFARPVMGAALLMPVLLLGCSEGAPGSAGAEDPSDAGERGDDGRDPTEGGGGQEGEGPEDDPKTDEGSPRPDDAPDPPPDERPACGPGASEPVCARGICEGGACVEPEQCDRVSHCLGDRVCVGGRCADPCVTHADCGEGRECTDSLCGLPPARECDANRPCTGRRVCHSTLSVCVEPAGCVDDSDCDVTRWGPRSCDRDTGVCRYCVDDEDCPPDRSCTFVRSAGEPICQEPARCEQHGSCLSARRCDVIAGECVFDAACVDDPREPNDTAAQADQNHRAHLAEARYTGLSLCPASEDWYRVRVPPGRGLQATLRYLAPFDDLDLSIWDDSGERIALGEGPPNAERAVIPGNLPGGGFRYLQVTSRRDGPNHYSLEVDLPECVDDLGEEDDTVESARPLRNLGASGWLCGPDVDWYRLDVPPDSEAVVDLLHHGEPGDLSLAWTARPGATGATRRGQAVTGGVALRTPTGARGDRWISIEGEERIREAYRLDVSFSPTGCQDDAREPNDGRLSSAPLTPGANRLLIACPSDPDWFHVDLEQGDGVRVRTIANPAEAMEIGLYAPNATNLVPTLLSSPEGGELRMGRAPFTGRYLLKVQSQTRVGYRLDLTVVPGGFCTNDLWEINDEIGQEAALSPGEHDLMLCPQDKDRFVIEVDEGSILDIGATYDPLVGQGVALAVFDPQGRLLGESAVGDGRETVRGLARESGAFTIRVGRQAGDEEIPYRLSAFLEPVNDRCDHPVSIQHGRPVRASTSRARDDLRGSCGGSGPDVVYRLELDRPSGVEAILTPEGRSFPAALHMRTDCGDPRTEVACERDADRDGAVTLRAPYLRGGSYDLIVDSVDRERSGNFRLDVRVVPDGICFPDDREPDDSPQDAAIVGEGRMERLSLCPDDEDWFAVDVPDEHDLVVSVAPRGDAAAIEFAVLDEHGQIVAGPMAAPGDLRSALRRPGPRLVVVRGGPGEYDAEVAFVNHAAPEDSCLDPPLLRDGQRFEGDTRALHDFHRSGCGNAGDDLSRSPEAIYRIHLENQSSIKATVTGDYDRVVYLRRACDDPGAELVCVDDWIDPPEVLQHPHLDAGEYFIFVDGYDGQEGPYEITFAVRPPYFPPENDTCATALPLPVGRHVRGTTRLAEDHYASTCTRRRGHAAPDVVYRFELDALTRVRLTLEEHRVDGEAEDAGVFDSVLYLRRDCLNDTPPVACVDEPEPQVIDAFLGAGEYFVFVDGWREGEGDFRLLMEQSEPN